MTDQPAKIGRPCEFTQDIADRICAELAAGRSLRSVCAQDDMPCSTTVFRWLRTVDSFAQQYARAKEESADALAEEMLAIADDGENDTYVDDKGKVCVDNDVIQRSKLRVDTRKWLASKLKPKKYGDRLALAGDEKQPLNVVVRKLTEEPKS